MQDLLNDDWQNYLERMFIDVLCNPSSYAVISREDTKNKCYLKCINSYRGNISIFLAVNSQITTTSGKAHGFNRGMRASVIAI